MDQQVKDGKMTQAQADQALAMMDKFAGPGMLKIFGGAGAALGSFAPHFLVGVCFVANRHCWFLKEKIPFLKMVELAGLATMIPVLGAVITTLLTVITGKLGITPSVALLISQYDTKNMFHLLVGAVNLFNFWQIVVAAGLPRLAASSYPGGLQCAGFLAGFRFGIDFIQRDGAHLGTRGEIII